MRARLWRIDRERAAEIVRSMPKPEDPTEAEKGTWEFTAPDRTEEAVAAEKTRAEAASEAAGGVFRTEEWVTTALERTGQAFAELALDAVNMAIDPEPEAEAEDSKPKVPRFVHQVGTKDDDSGIVR